MLELIFKTMCYKIDNPLNVHIETKEIYSGIFEHTVPEEYYFESFGCSYGNRIYTGSIPSNYYIIKERKKDGTIHKEL